MSAHLDNQVSRSAKNHSQMTKRLKVELTTEVTLHFKETALIFH